MRLLLLSLSLSFGLLGLTPATVTQIWLQALLLLEEKSGLAILLYAVFLSLVPHLVVDCDLVLGHLDVFLHDADLLLFLWSLEAEIGWVLRLTSH